MQPLEYYRAVSSCLSPSPASSHDLPWISRHLAPLACFAPILSSRVEPSLLPFALANAGFSILVWGKEDLRDHSWKGVDFISHHETFNLTPVRNHRRLNTTPTFPERAGEMGPDEWGPLL